MPLLRSKSSIARSGGLPAVDTVLQDLRFAFRLIAKGPRFSAAAILALALGIGVNAIGFAIVNAAFLPGTAVRGFGPALHADWQLGWVDALQRLACGASGLARQSRPSPASRRSPMPR